MIILLIHLHSNEYYKKSNFYFHLYYDLYCLHMHIFWEIEHQSNRRQRHICILNTYYFIGFDGKKIFLTHFGSIAVRRIVMWNINSWLELCSGLKSLLKLVPGTWFYFTSPWWCFFIQKPLAPTALFHVKFPSLCIWRKVQLLNNSAHQLHPFFSPLIPTSRSNW